MSRSTAEVTSKWWTSDKSDVATHVFSYVESLEADQAWVRYSVELNERLYTNRNPDSPGVIPGYAQVLGYDVPVSTENYLAAVCDTYAALIGTSKPKPTFQTNGALFKAQRTAKKLQKFCLGLFDKHKVYEKGAQTVLATAVHGMGGVKVFAEDNDICVDTVMIDDIVVDEKEARNCPPQQIHQRRWIDRDVLKGLYPKYKEQIGQASSAYGLTRGRRTTTQVSNSANSIPVIESWRLPSSKDAKDGRYTVSIKGTCLHDETYEKDYFPFVFLYYKKPLRGFYGQGIVEAIAEIQMDLNEANEFVKEVHRLFIAPRVYGDFGNKLPVEALTNEVGLYINTRGGKPPTLWTPQVLPAEAYNERERKIEKMFAIAGISEMVARARKEPGIDAGVAIREMNDVQSGRFAPQSMNLEAFYLEIAKRCVWLAKDLHEAEAEVKAEYRERNSIKVISWKDVDIGNDNFDISIEAASLLGNTPAGRLAKGMDLLKVGAIDVAEFRHLIDHPDIDRTLEQQDAPRKDIEAAIENLMEGQWEQPDPLQDLVLGIKLMKSSYREIARQEAPEEILELFRRWVDMAQMWLDRAAKGAQDVANQNAAPAPETTAEIAPPPALPSAIPGGN